MRKVFFMILLMACSQEDDPVAPNPGGGIGGSMATDWMVTDLVQAGNVVISASNATSQNIFFQLRKNGVYITDNTVNECTGRFTTDNKKLIDFDNSITCTKVAGDPPEFGNFKDVLTKSVGNFVVNADTSELTLSKDAMTYIKLKRQK